MSQVELYQSILLKLGRIPSRELSLLDAYLSSLEQQSSTQQAAKGIAHLAGAWRNWDDGEFEDFLKETQKTRQDMFIERAIQL